MFDLMMKKLTKKTVFSTLLLGTLILTACGNKETVEQTQNSSEIQIDAKPIDCQSDDAIASMRRAVVGQIRHQVVDNIEQISQKAGLTTANIDLNHSVGTYYFHFLESVATQNQGECQVILEITISPSDLAHANKVFQGTQGKSLEESLLDKGYELSNNTIFVEKLLFRLTDIDGGYQTKSVNADGILNSVAEILSNSKLNQIMVGSKKTTLAKTQKQVVDTVKPTETLKENLKVLEETVLTPTNTVDVNHNFNANTNINETPDSKKTTNLQTNIQVSKKPSKETVPKKLAITTISETTVIRDAKTGAIISSKTTTSDSGDVKKIMNQNND